MPLIAVPRYCHWVVLACGHVRGMAYPGHGRVYYCRECRRAQYTMEAAALWT